MKVLITDPVSSAGKSVLTEAGIEIIDRSQDASHSLRKDLSAVDGWILRSGTRATGDLIAGARHLKVIGRAGVGVDNIDMDAATLNGVVVMNTPGVNTVSAAEHTIALILSQVKNVPWGYASLREGKWEHASYLGSELRGKTLGVVGLGKVGTEVIKRLHGFGMKIVGYDPYVKKSQIEVDGVYQVDLGTLCKESDIVTLHVPLTDTTQRMFDLSRLKSMKPTAFLINCARGEVVVEKDLREALDQGIIAGAAVDVFENEPAGDSPLLKARNILFTPHLGASTREAREGVSRVICEQVRDFLLEGRVASALNLPVADFSLLTTLKPHLDLAEKLGTILQQVGPRPVERIQVQTHGSLENVKLVTLAFLKGFLDEVHANTVNYVNAAVVAESHGIQIQETYSHGDTDYSNLISATVVAGDDSLTIRGSLFSEKHPRVVYFNGFHLDLEPRGILLMMYNKDVPGVVGKVGTFLGNHGINIAGYLLGRKEDARVAFGIMRLDSPLNDSTLKDLSRVPEILEVKQITL
ncbi:MAG: phosphoglycerate dehydrogenase [Fidelibacterota bacterium]